MPKAPTRPAAPGVRWKALSRCRRKSALGRQILEFQAAVTASRHVLIGAARKVRCVEAGVRWRWTYPHAARPYAGLVATRSTAYPTWILPIASASNPSPAVTSTCMTEIADLDAMIAAIVDELAPNLEIGHTALRGGRGAQKIGGTTTCIGLCTWHRDAAPNRNEAGYSAARQRCVGRMHGAAGGAPRANRNALKHGGFAAETLALKREVQALARLARQTMAAIE